GSVTTARSVKPPATLLPNGRAGRHVHRRGAKPGNGFQRWNGPLGLVLRSGRCGVNSSEQVPPNDPKPPAQAAARDESCEPGVPPEKWQALEALWKAILGLEASIEAV